MSERPTDILITALALIALVSACAIYTGSAYRVVPRQLCPADSVRLDSLRRAGGECSRRDSSEVKT